MSDLRQRRHNSTATLLLELLNNHTKGTWLTVAKDTGRHPPHTFDQAACIPELRETQNPPLRPAPTRREDVDEGLTDDMARRCSMLIPDWILPRHLLPEHCKPDIIRITGCTMQGNRLTPTPGSTPDLQIIEFKYSTDHNAHLVHEHTQTKYSRLKSAIEQHGSWPHTVTVIPVILGRTGSFDPKTKAAIYRLIYLKDKPPDEPYPKHIHSLLTILHDHAVHWLQYLLTISCKHLSPRPPTKPPRPG